MKLTRRDLKNIIILEMEKMIDEDTLVQRKSPGIRAVHDDPGRQMVTVSKRSCYECGYSMKEEDSVCEQCGSMYEINLNEGDCGCASDCDCRKVSDYSLDSMHSPTHSKKQRDYKIGNHKIFKGSYMAKNHMYKTAKYAAKLYHMIPDGHNLEDWMRSKLAQIADDIGEVYHALDHDIFEGDV